MEVREQPRTDTHQRCIQFHLSVSPRAQVQAYKDYMGNVIHMFDIPGRHQQLAIRTEATVEVKLPVILPDALPYEEWEALDNRIHEDRDLYDMVLPSQFARSSDALTELQNELDISREDMDVLTFVRTLNTAIYNKFDYIQNETAADSPIEIALERRLGVCQDFAHIMIAVLRDFDIPARYISGYLFHRTDEDRSAADATHAWLEAWIPTLGWVGFDPTNNLICNEQHIRVAIGRDYSDVPPTKGIFHGNADSTLEVEVDVRKLDELPLEDEVHSPEIRLPSIQLLPQQQQQQQ